MPELPEVETVRRGLERFVVGRPMRLVEVMGTRTVRRHPAEWLLTQLPGRVVRRVTRRGKYLVLGLDDEVDLVLHLRMSGQLRARTPSSGPRLAHTKLVVRLDGADELHFVDPRTFGEAFISAGRGASGRPIELARLGLDPVLDGVDPEALAALSVSRSRPIKVLLTDQQLIAGIGNVYADEICFRAGLLPYRGAGELTDPEIERLAAAITSTLGEAIEYGGSTLRDERYCDLFGAPGRFQSHHFVYGRAGQRCARCGTDVVGIRLAGRSSCYCPSCQC